jgi:hypothetical protein
LFVTNASLSFFVSLDAGVELQAAVTSKRTQRIQEAIRFIERDNIEALAASQADAFAHELARQLYSRIVGAVGEAQPQAMTAWFCRFEKNARS